MNFINKITHNNNENGLLIAEVVLSTHMHYTLSLSLSLCLFSYSLSPSVSPTFYPSICIFFSLFVSLLRLFSSQSLGPNTHTHTHISRSHEPPRLRVYSIYQPQLLTTSRGTKSAPVVKIMWSSTIEILVNIIIKGILILYFF